MLTVTLLLMSCTSQGISVINASCAGFSVISASRQDTTETLRQIKVHNDTYRTICQRGGDVPPDAVFFRPITILHSHFSGGGLPAAPLP